MGISHLPDDIRIERKITMRDQIAQSRGSAADLGRKLLHDLRWQFLVGFADDLQVEQYRVEAHVIRGKSLKGSRLDEFGDLLRAGDNIVQIQ